jgi:hypothetical protein
VVLALLVAAYAEHRLLLDPDTYQTDQLIHEFWMRKWRDPGLFSDPLTKALLETDYIPPGVIALYWTGSHLVDPVTLSKWMPLLLVPVSAWLVFRIVREQCSWAPGGWLGSALFLSLFEIHRMSGGHARAFYHPVVLTTVYLALRKRDALAALGPPLGVLLYPPAGLTALGTLCVSAIQWGRPPALERRRAAVVLVSAVLLAAAAFGPRLVTGSSPELITKSQALRYEEFGPRGQMHYFRPSLKSYLKSNYSGFNLRYSGSVLVVAALFLAALRPRNVRLLRHETWSLAASSLALFAIAQATLFMLYLPQRYTYALIPFLCVFIAVCVRPTWDGVRARVGSLPATTLLAAAVAVAASVVAITVWPLGPEASFAHYAARLGADAGLLISVIAAGACVWLVYAAAARPSPSGAPAVVCGIVLVALMATLGQTTSPALPKCPTRRVHEALGSLAKDAVIAADQVRANCIPIVARRPVLISRKLYQPFEVNYFGVIRPRMRDLVDAYYGPSIAAVRKLREAYGADYLLVDRKLALRTKPGPRRSEPFWSQLAGLLADGRRPAVLSLPRRCAVYRRGSTIVYDLGCV